VNKYVSLAAALLTPHAGRDFLFPMAADLYVFEGPDGVGKSTLASFLCNHLNQRGVSTLLLSFPGREAGTLGEHIYRLYHAPQSFGIPKLSAIPEQLLLTAAHVDVIENRLIPALNTGSNVVLDRYWWSTWVYGTASKVAPEMTQRLIDLELLVWNTITPACVFLVSRHQSLKPQHIGEKWNALTSLYRDLRATQSSKVRIVDVDNDHDLESSTRVVLNAIG
jgi:dTMP kinase